MLRTFLKVYEVRLLFLFLQEHIKDIISVVNNPSFPLKKRTSLGRETSVLVSYHGGRNRARHPPRNPEEYIDTQTERQI
jgi:hypothetical protein